MPVGKYKHHPQQGFQKGYTPWNKGKKNIFSKETLERMSEVRKGKFGINNPNWKNGETRHKGYMSIRQPAHPQANKNGYILRSHLVMGKHLGRYLTPKEIVHHINEIKDDDRIENLQLFANKNNHIKFHHKLRRKIK